MLLNIGIDFVAAALVGLLIVPLVHRRAVRLTMRRLDETILHSVGEIRADKDQLRASLANSAHQLELTVEKMKTRAAAKIAEFGEKADVINRLEKELENKSAIMAALETNERALRDQLHDKETDLVRLVAELGHKSAIAESRRVEIADIRTEVEAIRQMIARYEDARALRDHDDELFAPADGRGPGARPPRHTH
jgi:chromosome segregation ATPase